MTASVWNELAIAPTTDQAAIRRAYAARLKQCRPDDDPAGFVRLRAAYEAALRGASKVGATRPEPPSAPRPPVPEPQSKHEPQPPASPRPPVAEPPPPPLPKPTVEHEQPPPPRGPAESPPPPATHDPPPPLAELQVSLALARGDVTDAAARLLTAQGDTAMALGPWMRLTDQLARRLSQDLAIEDSVVLSLARQFGWDSGPDRGATAAVKALRARTDTIGWLARVRTSAAKPSRFIGNEHAAACALLLGRGRLRGSWLLPPYAQLLPLLAEAEARQPWAERALDPVRLAQLRALCGDKRGQTSRRVVLAGLFFLAYSASGQVPLALLVPVYLYRIRFALLRRVAAGAAAVLIVPLLLGATLQQGLGYSIVVVAAGLIASFVVAILNGAKRTMRRRGLTAKVRIIGWLTLRIALAAAAGALVVRVIPVQSGGALSFVAIYALLTLARRHTHWVKRLIAGDAGSRRRA